VSCACNSRCRTQLSCRHDDEDSTDSSLVPDMRNSEDANTGVILGDFDLELWIPENGRIAWLIFVVAFRTLMNVTHGVNGYENSGCKD
jgi:hypothetical protein